MTDDLTAKPRPEKTNYSLWSLIKYFLMLGTIGFGGPVALVGYMHRDLVEKKAWIPEEEYKQGLALAQLAPGPLAAQLAIYMGYVHYRILGATLAGIAFVLPSFLMVLGIGFAYKTYGGLEWMQAMFYGVGAAVAGIIVMSTYKLTLKSVSKPALAEIKQKWLLWLFFLVSALITYTTKTESMLLFLGCGLFYMLIKNPPKPINKFFAIGLMPVALFSVNELSTLEQIAVFFGKAGAFVFGSGLAIVPFLHSGVVIEHHWLTEKQFLDAIAVAMITPGPVVITVGFIGYLVSGLSGAVVAALATFLPCYLFTIIPAPYFKKYGNHPAVKNFVDGITATVVGALAGATVIIAAGNISDIATALIALASVLVLGYVKKIQEPVLILLAAAIGVGLKLI